MADRLREYDVFALPLSSIYYDADFNCRGQFTLESVSELAESIRQKGGGVELRGLDFPVWCSQGRGRGQCPRDLTID